MMAVRWNSLWDWYTTRCTSASAPAISLTTKSEVREVKMLGLCRSSWWRLRTGSAAGKPMGLIRGCFRSNLSPIYRPFMRMTAPRTSRTSSIPVWPWTTTSDQAQSWWRALTPQGPRWWGHWIWVTRAILSTALLISRSHAVLRKFLHPQRNSIASTFRTSVVQQATRRMTRTMGRMPIWRSTWWKTTMWWSWPVMVFLTTSMKKISWSAWSTKWRVRRVQSKIKWTWVY